MMGKAPRRWLRLLGASALAAVVAAGAAAADWLVMRDGGRLETRGPWELRGPQILFTSVRGTLSSVRVSEVDLDASATATVEARKAAERPAAGTEAPPQAVVTITDEDVPRYVGPLPVPPGAAETGGEGQAAAPPAGEPPAGGVTLAVTSWREVESDDIDGLEIYGTVTNSGNEIATNLAVTVTLVDDAGQPLTSANAFVRTPAVAPGGNVSFRAPFPGVYQIYGEPQFAVRGRGLRLESASQPSRAAEGT